MISKTELGRVSKGIPGWVQVPAGHCFGKEAVCVLEAKFDLGPKRFQTIQIGPKWSQVTKDKLDFFFFHIFSLNSKLLP